MIRILYLLAVSLPVTHGQLPLMSSRGTNSDCDTECHDERPRTLCGTDGKTYKTFCELSRAKCEGHNVELKHLGKCAEPLRCRAERARAEAQARNLDSMVYIPECREDGNYAEVQCESSIGYCWCVDPVGRPVPGSSLRFKKPICSQQGCKNAERMKFNENIIEIFKTEYYRVVSPPSHADSRLSTTASSEVKRVVQFKFDQLDINKDNCLKRKEVRSLSRMTKKIVIPRECAKNFIVYCDFDQDGRISRNEWYICLGLDINKMTSIRDLHGMRLKHYDAEEETDSLTDSADDGDGFNYAENQNCMTARESAMDSHRQDPAGGIYIPECNDDGTYQKSQCHKKISVCWCVNPKSGKPIRGTGVRGNLPDCDNMMRRTKTFKGCSFQRNLLFMDELIRYFSDQASQAANSTQSPQTIAKDEIVRLKFKSLDVNSNKLLDKREWIAFRSEWKTFLRTKKHRRKTRKLRKCWRNFPRLCDNNRNNKISFEEWSWCTGVGRESRQHLVSSQRRKGPNPFSTILKSE